MVNSDNSVDLTFVVSWIIVDSNNSEDLMFVEPDNIVFSMLVDSGKIMGFSFFHFFIFFCINHNKYLLHHLFYYNQFLIRLNLLSLY